MSILLLEMKKQCLQPFSSVLIIYHIVLEKIVILEPWLLRTAQNWFLENRVDFFGNLWTPLVFKSVCVLGEEGRVIQIYLILGFLLYIWVYIVQVFTSSHVVDYSKQQL